jgi:hypothetical protein
MIPLMVKEADLDRIEVPEDYEVLDATALGRRLGFKRDTVLPTSRGGISSAYLAPTGSLPWGPSGTRRASESGKTKRVTGRSVNCGSERWREG